MLGRFESRIVAILCALAVLRVLAFAAVFPLYNNVDEYFHFDYVWKWAHGEFPDRIATASRPCAELVVTYGWMAQYLFTEETVNSPKTLPPMWTLPRELRNVYIDKAADVFASLPNHELVQPPFYYAAAAGWYRIGKALGVPDTVIPFWVRFLNAPCVGLMVWLSYRLARLFFAQNAYMRMGVPLIISVFPQDVFYGITNGTMGPLMFTVALYGLAVAATRREAGWGLYLTAGLASGATVITMYTAAPVLIAVAAAAVLLLRQARDQQARRHAVRNLVALSLGTLLLPVVSCTRNYLVVGSLTMQPLYVEYAGWTPLSFAEMLHHPIFTLKGATFFWSALMSSFFRGEYVWMAVRLAYPWLDAFYIWSALAFLVIAFLTFLPRKNPHRAIGFLSAAMFAASILMLVWASIQYDFGNWFFPSREKPYASAGRLMLGMLAPFVFMYLTGLDKLLAVLHIQRLKWAALIVIAGLTLGSEIVLTLPVIHSARCNFFDLLWVPVRLP